MALHRYGDFRVEVFYFDSPCIMSPTEDINVPIILQYEQLSHVQCNTWHNKFMQQDPRH